MPKFAYAAIDATGAPIEGVTKADTIGAARSLLVEQNLFPTKIEERRGMLDFELTKEKVKKKELMHFTRQLAVFVKAGIPITDALVVIGDETEDVALRRALSNLVDDLRNGGLFSAAAAGHPEVFPDYYVGILQSAELTGQLDTALESLSDYLEREIETRSKVVSALSYPMVVMVMAMITVLILAGYVLPQFKPLFEELDAELPLPTRMLLAFSRLFTDLWFITAALLPGHRRDPDVPLQAPDRQALEQPSGAEDPGRSRASSTTRSSNGSVASSRRCSLPACRCPRVSRPRPMQRATSSTRNVSRSPVRRCSRGRGSPSRSSTPSCSRARPRQMFKVGEETGTLDMQLAVASVYFDRELESRIKKFTTMFEPLMIIFVGLIVGFVAVALVSAMYGVLNGTKEQI